MSALLALNVGSSSLKFTSFEVSGDAPILRLNGLIEGIGQNEARFTVKDTQGMRIHDETLVNATHHLALMQVLAFVKQHATLPEAIVHRVVHGGSHFFGATLVNDDVRTILASLTPLAPLHQPGALAGLDAAMKLADVPQIACFDTAFHTTQDPLATRFGIDDRWHREGVRRYSFHGLSYAAIARQLPQVLGEEEAKKRIVILHLGSGSSACVIHNGKSVANSTGMSACDGLMMGTRPGAMDPEVILYWMENAGMDIARVRQELYKKSGLLGVSGGISADMRDLLNSNEAQAAIAVDLFCYRVAREVGALAAQAGGIDHIVFTAGIGERSAAVREKVLARLAWLGFSLDMMANDRGETCITTSDSERHAWVLATDEEGQMAREALALLRSK